MSTDAPAGTQMAMRLACRVEGRYVNAYIADPSTMQDAVLIGSISRKLCDDTPGLFERWVALMSEGVVAQIKLATGVDASFGALQPAAEHEKSGHG